LPVEMGEMKELITLNLSFNLLKKFPVQLSKLHRLSTLNLCHNSIATLDNVDLSKLPLATLDMSHNQMVESPGEISLCLKLKDLHLNNNPFKDKKLVKVLEGGKVKSVLQILQKTAPSKKKEEEEEEEEEPLRIKIENPAELVQVVVLQNQTVRPYIVLTVIKGFNFNDESFKQIIDLQTELHQSLCKKRALATIGTHDMSLFKPPIMYCAKAPNQIKFIPLKVDKALTGEEIAKHFEDIKEENMIKYMLLIKNQPTWPILEDSTGEVMSLPPVINSKYSQISLQTKDILLEVTSATNLQICKDVAGAFLARLVKTIPADQQLIVEQVKVQGENGHVRIQYPSQKDLEEICATLN